MPLFLPVSIWLLEIVRGERIPFSPVRTLRTRELSGFTCLALPFGPRGLSRLPRGQYYPRTAAASRYLLPPGFAYKTRTRSLRVFRFPRNFPKLRVCRRAILIISARYYCKSDGFISADVTEAVNSRSGKCVASSTMWANRCRCVRSAESSRDRNREREKEEQGEKAVGRERRMRVIR